VRAERWPGAAREARSGLALVDAISGVPPARTPSAADLAASRPIVLLETALGRGDVTAARAIAQTLLRAGHPLGPVYASALALERGDDEEAWRLAAQSPAPLGTYPLGSELERTLDARARGARAMVRDRNGALVGTLGADGSVEVAAGLDPRLVEQPLGEVKWTGAERGGVRLTLDLGLSHVAAAALGDSRGTVVLLEPRTGAVLAAVSDERTARSERAAAFRQRREPASIAKVLTAAAAYRAGIDADAEIGGMRCRGVERFGGQPLWCSWPAGPLAGLDHALAVSCNTSFATLGARVGRERLLDEFRRWGFDAAPDALFGAAGHIHPVPRNARQLADFSIGLTHSDITPLHAALLATVVADGGTMPEPRLVFGSCGPLGLSDVPEPLVAPRPVLDRETVAPLLKAMSAVAVYGTGSGLAPAALPVAMKTGTAAEHRMGYHVNYIGLAPPEDPVVAFCVRVTHRPTSRAVSRAAREVTMALFAGLADRRGSLERAARRQRAQAQ